ncbi:MAG: cation:proton antiporter subunit C [Caulobacterales bacterium]|nr:cation:proton antiporter subunit C [Caulobacterales bacterium]
MSLVTHYNYWIVIILMMTGLYIVFASGNMVKRLVGLGVFQTSVFLFYISIGKVAGGIPPILPEDKTHHGDDGHNGGGDHGAAAGHGAATGEDALHSPALGAESHGGGDGYGAGDAHGADAHAAEILYSNPLPHVLILTAIVVGVATLAVGLALVVRVCEAYGTIEDDEISRDEYDAEVSGADA